MKIAIAGKGGVGKTIISALLVRELIEHGKGPILVIDADPNANLNIPLGIDYNGTIADIVEELKTRARSGISKVDILKMEFQNIITEEENFDFLVMGAPEGPGCYCAVNDILREILNQFSRNYPYVIFDAEAGLEHLSRKTAGELDLLILVSEPSLSSLHTLLRAKNIADKTGLTVKEFLHIINKVRGELSSDILDFMFKNQLLPFLTLPFSENLLEVYERGENIFEFWDGNFLKKFAIIVKEKILKNGGGK
ncbi:MAG: AAA family ATPase [Candidatus Omnitrophica bacterium]|nr:AAA family ATPase [Candidatus Omnitrophota bacterium]